MAVIDLNTRLTSNWDDYNKNLKSSDSLIYIEPQTYIFEDGPASIDLTIGDNCYLQNEKKYYEIPNDGIILRPGKSLLIETAQRVALPLNVFGLVTGKGSQIFQGTFVSTGKINPGFNSKLKIGLYNGSKQQIKLKRGDSLCTCVFFEMESGIQTPLKRYDENSVQMRSLVSKTKKITVWLKENKEVIAITISLIALIASVALLHESMYKLKIAYPDFFRLRPALRPVWQFE